MHYTAYPYYNDIQFEWVSDEDKQNNDEDGSDKIDGAKEINPFENQNTNLDECFGNDNRKDIHQVYDVEKKDVAELDKATGASKCWNDKIQEAVDDKKYFIAEFSRPEDCPSCEKVNKTPEINTRGKISRI